MSGAVGGGSVLLGNISPLNIRDARLRTPNQPLKTRLPSRIRRRRTTCRLEGGARFPELVWPLQQTQKGFASPVQVTEGLSRDLL